MIKTDYIKWWKTTFENDLEELEKTFIDLFSGVNFLPAIYHPILYEYLKGSELKHWNKDIFYFSRNKISGIMNKLGEELMKETLLSNLHLLARIYQHLLDIEERIILMNRFKGNEELKAKIFSINIYNDLLNTSFSDCLKLFIEFQSILEDKNLTQNSLTSQIECLSGKRREYNKITNLADSDIRNAISHGGVKTENTKMLFSYRIGNQYCKKELNTYEFKDSLLKLYDGVSAILLAWIGYLCEENISYCEIYENKSIHEEASHFYEKLSLSTLLTTCDRVWQVDVKNNKNKRKQTNVEFSGADLDVNSRLFFGLCTAERIFQLRKMSENDSIMIAFNSPKILNSFFKVDCTVIDNLLSGDIDIGEAIKIVWESRNVLMFPINDEKRNIYEDKFRYYPDIETDDFSITEIEDISNAEQKRFKGVVYLKRAKRRNQVQKDIESILEKLKLLENYGFSSHQAKHGKMETDIIYLVLYKKEIRRNEDRSLLPNNNNFIAQVQYDIDKIFPIRNKLIDKNLKKSRIRKVEYNWNPNF